jgi:toxin ParE1/3/4
MTSYEVCVASEAERDLWDTYEYITTRLKSPRAARGQFARIRAAIEGLAQMPKRFRAYDREPWRSRGMRVRPVDNCLVFYVVDDAERKVTVVRVTYGGMDVDSALERMVDV